MPSRTTAPVIVSAPAVAPSVVDNVPFRCTDAAVISMPPSLVVMLPSVALSEVVTVKDSSAFTAPAADCKSTAPSPAAKVRFRFSFATESRA